MRLLGSLALTLLATAGFAQEKTVGDLFRAVEPSDLITAFVGTCVQSPGRLDKVGAFAEAMDYATTPEPYWTMFAPQSASASYHSWMVAEGQGAPYTLGISEAPLRDELYQICVVSNPFMNADDALRELKELVTLSKKIADDETAGNRIQVWMTPSILEGSFISLTDIRAMGVDGMTLSIAAPKQY